MIKLIAHHKIEQVINQTKYNDKNTKRIITLCSSCICLE